MAASVHQLRPQHMCGCSFLARRCLSAQLHASAPSQGPSTCPHSAAPERLRPRRPAPCLARPRRPPHRWHAAGGGSGQPAVAGLAGSRGTECARCAAGRTCLAAGGFGCAAGMARGSLCSHCRKQAAAGHLDVCAGAVSHRGAFAALATHTGLAFECPPHLPPAPQARIQAAQYAHLPLASIGPDWIIDAADAVFARQLRECRACRAGC